MNLIEIIKETCEILGLDWALIGGLALPVYGGSRVSWDLDVAIHFHSQEDLMRLLEELEKYGVKTAQKPRLEHQLFVVFNPELRDEAEIWLRPCDAFLWDEDITQRLRKSKVGDVTEIRCSPLKITC
ncbi:MAG: hypothetical protein ACFFD4_28170 [Candidatus Odinarchaeota archaeon]